MFPNSAVFDPEAPPIEPNLKWVRGMLDGEALVDARNSSFVWEHPNWPSWFFPRDAIAGELREASGIAPKSRHLPGVVYYDIVAGDRVFAGAARGYPDSAVDDLRELVAVGWRVVDRWLEEDVEVTVHPRSPYVRVDTLASSRHVVVSIDGTVVADTRRPTLLFETGLPTRHYIPADDVSLDLLTASPTRTSCPYKGEARYWSLEAGGTKHADLAWAYESPLPESAGVAGMICFYDEQVEIEIDGVRQERR